MAIACWLFATTPAILILSDGLGRRATMAPFSSKLLCPGSLPIRSQRIPDIPELVVGGAYDRIVPKFIHAAPAGRKRLAVADYPEIRRGDGNNRACAFPRENLQRNLGTELPIRRAAEDSRHAQRPIL
jgi:hypothetical protein